VPSALEQVVMRCIAKDPADRYESMAELEAALCEAQIAADLRTEWDDLPLPDVAPERRERIEARMPRPASRRSSRRRRWVALASCAAAAIVGIAWLPSSSVGAADHERVEQLAASARAAATRGAYVYPLPDAPDESAYATLVALESIEGPAASLADDTAAQLRRTLADELLTLGDSYWSEPDARPYARDYYAQAVLFDPQSSHARERAGFTPGELSDLRVRAETQTFSEPELAAAEPLAVLATVDETERDAVLSEALAAEPAPSVTWRRRARAREDHRAAKVAETPVVMPVVAMPPPLQLSDTKANGFQRVGARTLARKAQRAFARGDRDEAAVLFQRALEQDPRNGAAMRGLSDVYFDRGEYERALQYARRGTEVEPNAGAGYIRLGDAWAKLLDYGAARQAYRRALALGRSDASDRLLRLDRLSK
ncbi:MAG TPA: tetratricopeptide repeat protein, partial [Nannocystaceae bacterium]|nr:tetratricopeptide repeat protein [Nannocystaceae bacterium]